MENKIIQGDCLDKLKELPDNSIDMIATDPPYGYSFMGSNWDKVIPSIDIWKECLRVMKPGSFAFIMSAPRQDVLSRTMIRLEDAGFRTDFTSIYWTYASGFPKAHNISKAIDKRNGKSGKVIGENPYNKIRGKSSSNHTIVAPQDKCYITEPESSDAIKFKGAYGGMQPKPAVECIIVAMKPMTEKTFVDQALKNGKGIVYFDECRIPYQNKDDKEYNLNLNRFTSTWGNTMKNDQSGIGQEQGRFPANLLCSDNILDGGKITKGAYGGMQPKPAVECIIVAMKPMTEKTFVDQALKNGKGIVYFDECRIPFKSDADKSGAGWGHQTGNISCYNKGMGDMDGINVPASNDAGRFPANLLCSDNILDDGKITKGATSNSQGKKTDVMFHSGGHDKKPGPNNSGSFSRYFDLDKWAENIDDYFKQNLPESVQKTFPCIIVPKASKGEKNTGLDPDKFPEKLGDKKLYITSKCIKCDGLEIHSDKDRRCKCEKPEYRVKIQRNAHPTVKPVKLFAYLITMGSREGDTILDPFMGSGTTGIAAKLLNRNFIGIELSQKYIDIAEPRLDAYKDYQKFIIEKPKEDFFNNNGKEKPIQEVINKFF